MKRLAFFAVYLCCASCMNGSDGSGSASSLHQATRLGHSNYFIQVPDDIEIAEAKGLKGQPGYSFHLKKEDFSSLGFLSVDSGGAVKAPGASECPVRSTDYVYARLLEDRVRWVIEDHGRFLDATASLGSVSANIYTHDRKYIDRMIDIFSTLRKTLK